ncbi:MAG: 50S ribosomal protein L10 [Bacteroidota bacterium]
MTREEKNSIIEELVGTLSQYNSFYITDIDTLNSEHTSKLRRLCFNKQVQMRVAKNSLIKKALERIEGDFSQLIPTLKGSSAILASEGASTPAKLIRDFRRDAGKNFTKPVLKSAYIDGGVFVGDNQLEVLASLKSKNELIGDVIGLLQSPAKSVISGLKGQGGKIAGILKTLEDRAA